MNNLPTTGQLREAVARQQQAQADLIEALRTENIRYRTGLRQIIIAIGEHDLAAAQRAAARALGLDEDASD